MTRCDHDAREVSRDDAIELIAAAPAETVLAFDFDGTLAPIVSDPRKAFANADSISALSRIGSRVASLAIITGRPVDQVLELGNFRAHTGFEQLVIYGQYGAEIWSAGSDEIRTIQPPVQLGVIRDDIKQWLLDHDASDAYVEDKGLAIAVHTRGLGEGVLERLAEPLERVAAQNRLRFEPGRQVLELRTPGIDKGNALHEIVERVDARTVVFAGDDLGDVPAFDAVDELRAMGLNGLLICSASDEQDVLMARSDLVLDGPAHIQHWLQDLANRLDSMASPSMTAQKQG